MADARKRQNKFMNSSKDYSKTAIDLRPVHVLEYAETPVDLRDSNLNKTLIIKKDDYPIYSSNLSQKSHLYFAVERNR